MRKIILPILLCLALALPAKAVVSTYWMVDGDLAIGSNVTFVSTSTAFTAPRSLFIPKAAVSCIGQTCPALQLQVMDLVGAISNTNTLTIHASSGDTINGQTTLVLSVTNSTVTLWPISGTQWFAQVSSSTIGLPGASGDFTCTSLGVCTIHKIQGTTINSVPASGNLAGALSIVQQTFTSSGTYTPTTGTIYAEIECVGGGGGGGGAANSAANTSSGAGGGGGGGYSRVVASAATIGASQTVTIGAGGAGGSAGNNNGVSGGQTAVGAICVANGGIHGNGSASSSIGAGGAGGAAGTGTDTIPGQAGGGGFASGTAGVIAIGGSGGSSHWGAGGPSNATTGNANGAAGSNYGGGGAGGSDYNNAGTAAGGTGAGGYVTIRDYVSR